MKNLQIISGPTNHATGYKYFVAVLKGKKEISRHQTNDINEIPKLEEHLKNTYLR